MNISPLQRFTYDQITSTGEDKRYIILDDPVNCFIKAVDKDIDFTHNFNESQVALIRDIMSIGRKAVILTMESDLRIDSIYPEQCRIKIEDLTENS